MQLSQQVKGSRCHQKGPYLSIHSQPWSEIAFPRDPLIPVSQFQLRTQESRWVILEPCYNLEPD